MNKRKQLILTALGLVLVAAALVMLPIDFTPDGRPVSFNYMKLAFAVGFVGQVCILFAVFDHDEHDEENHPIARFLDEY